MSSATDSTAGQEGGSLTSICDSQVPQPFTSTPFVSDIEAGVIRILHVLIVQVMWSQLRGVQRAHGQKRKAGLLFDEPLSGAQLAPPPKGAGMPPLRPTTDERRLQWMRVCPPFPERTQLSRSYRDIGKERLLPFRIWAPGLCIPRYFMYNKISER